MSGGFYICLIVFVIWLIGMITKPLWNKTTKPKTNNSNESNAAKIQQLRNETRLYYLEKNNSLLKELQNCGTVEEAERLYNELKNGLSEFFGKGYIFSKEFDTYEKVLKLLSHEYKLKLLDIAHENMKQIANSGESENNENQIEEIYQELQNSVEITADYFKKLQYCMSIQDYAKYICNHRNHPDLVCVPKSKLEDWENEYNRRMEFDRNLSKVCALNNKGIKLEKSGNIDEAIITYEEGILIPYKAHHSYDRLLVLYRKKKDYQNEKRVCLKAIEMFPQETRYKDRLSKIEAKIIKASKP